MITDKQDLIRQRAYDLWIAEGRPDGRAKENWQEAERDLSAELADVPAADEAPAEISAPAEPEANATVAPFPEAPRTRARRRKQA